MGKIFAENWDPDQTRFGFFIELSDALCAQTRSCRNRNIG